MHRLTLLAFGLSLLLAAAATHADAPWPAAVAGHVPPAPGEHPRLLFRKADLPALKRKAETPVGKAIVARLKYLLGGGEAMPTEFNAHPPINIGAKGPAGLEPGAFTVNHAAGFGLLWQLTGDRKYADLARQCLDKVFEGQVDRDERYSWKKPGTGFRLSGVHQAVAIAYDLCYDAWPDDYRRKVINELQTNAPVALQANGPLSLEMLAGGGRYPPSSNHFGAYIAGPGFVALALRGDPGADTPRMEKLLATVEASLRTVLTKGWGDGGWFGEGTGSDKTAMLPGLAGLLQSLRIAGGVEWMENAPNARHILLTRALELVPGPDAVHRPERGVYAYGTSFYANSKRATFRDQGGWSADGLFCIGIGALPERYRPGLAWIYENFIEPDIQPEQRIYEARIDPIHAVYALVNWPIGQPTANPGAAFPLAVHDSLHGYVLARNRFQDVDDCLFTGLARRGPVGYHKVRAPQRVDVWGLGLRTTMGSLGGQTTHWQPGRDGSAVFTMGGVQWAVDYSQAADAPAVIVNIGGAAAKPAGKGGAKALASTVEAAGVQWNVLILTRGAAPQVRADGARLLVGQQSFTTDGARITPARFTPAN